MFEIGWDELFIIVEDKLLNATFSMSKKIVSYELKPGPTFIGLVGRCDQV